MLFSPVYIEAHPRRNAAFASRMNLRDAVHANSSRLFKSFNPFTFNSFRTLLHNGRLQPLSFQSLPDSFHRNGGVYPLAPSSSTACSPICSISRRPSLFSSTAYKMPLQQLLCFDNHPFSWGVYPPRFYPEPAATRRGANLAAEGRLSHFVLESAALEHLQRAMIQGSQPRGDTGRTIDCICAGCGTIARTETIERKRRS
jgi:hypothetical protein